MNRNESFSKRAGDFLAGRGFYIVLILCVAVIGASAWTMLMNTVDHGLDLPVIGEIEDPGQMPNVPVMGGIDRERPAVAPRPPEEETFFFGREEPEETPPSPPPPEEPTPAAQTIEEPQPLQFVWPVGGQVEVPHALDRLIFDRTMGDWRTHAGIDITAELGEPVLAVAAGTVERIFHDDLLGTTVIIYHGSGLQSLYANLVETPAVVEGQWVSMGTPVGAVGTTALAKTGVVHHLHLEIIENGVRVDPLLFLPER